MESISKSLQPYKSLIGNTAMVATIAQFLTGTLVCKKIHQQGNTNGISAAPFIGGLTIGILVLRYALMLNDNTMFIVNTVAIALNLIYTLFYYAYCTNRAEEMYKLFAIGFGVISLMFGYADWESPCRIEWRYGFIVTAMMLLLAGCPLLNIINIIKTKDASSIQFPLALAGAIVSVLWFLYGLCIENTFTVVQNFIGAVLCTTQVILSVIYPKGSDSRKGCYCRQRPS